MTDSMIDHNVHFVQAGQSRRDLLFQRAEEYEFKRAHREKRLQDEMRHCTFSPDVHRSATRGTSSNIVQRSKEWTRKREQNRESNRRAKAINTLLVLSIEDCRIGCQCCKTFLIILSFFIRNGEN